MEEENKVKNNNISKFIGIGILVVLVVIGFVAGWYYYKSNDTKTVFTSSINSSIDNFTKEMSDMQEIKSQNTTFKLSGNVNSDIKEVKQVAEYINKISLNTNVQIDYEAKKELVNLDINYDNDKIIDGQVYYDLGNKELYLYVEDLFNKYFKVDTSSKEYNEINEMMEKLLETPKQMKLGEKVSLEKASKILKEKIESKLVDEYFSKEKAEVTVDGKQVKTTKFKLTLTQTQFVDILSSICSELAEDEEFLNCWEDKDDVKEGLSKITEQLKDVDKDDDLKIEFNIYKKGLLNEFVKFEVVMSKDDENVSAEVIKTAKDTYSYRASTKTEEEIEIKGTIKTTKLDKDSYKCEFTINIPEFGEIALNFEFSNKINEGIDEINKSNSVSLESLTQNDMIEIQENLQKMKIYQLLEPLMSSTNSILDSELLDTDTEEADPDTGTNIDTDSDIDEDTDIDTNDDIDNNDEI